MAYANLCSTGGRWTRNILVAIGLAFSAGVFLLPFAFMLSTALKTPAQLYRVPMEWIPSPFAWSNFVEAWTVRPFTRFAGNTLIIAGVAMVGDVLSSSVVAFGFARLRFPGRDALFYMLLATMMIPIQATIIPVFLIYKILGWINTFLPLTVPAYFAVRPLYVFLIRQFMLTIPREYEEAARIDGAGTFQIFWRIFLPLSKPPLATVALFSFVYNWNDFFEPLIYLNSLNKKTLVLGLTMLQSQHDEFWHLVMSLAVIIALPCILIFFVGMRHFVQGITLTGLKG